MTQTLCLNMIVKNESHIIVETLEHLVSKIHFDYWVISDTGSTDNTKELIRDFFNKEKIPGELVEHEWRDFGYNRTKALECAYNKTDFLFIFDADDRIHGELVIPKVLENDSYILKFGKTMTYYRPLLISNRKQWEFRGVLHEFLIKLDGSCNPHDEMPILQGYYYIESRQLGDRSKNPKKYVDDAEILKRAYDVALSQNDRVLVCRYAFYCGQSYKDAGEEYYDDSIEWYKKCLELENGYQEKYVSAINIGNMYKIKNDNENAAKYWQITVECDHERIEGVSNIMQSLIDKHDYLLANALFYKFKDYKLILNDKLFLNTGPYLNYDLEYYAAISSNYIKDFSVGYDCCKKILSNLDVSNPRFALTMVILSVYKTQLIKDTEIESLFYKVDDFLQQDSIKIDRAFFDIWHILFLKIRGKIISKTPYNFVNKKRPFIFLSFTTCKRYELFAQTINSILNTWTDKDKIDYWFCVDDNSSEEHREKMLSNYPWINYYMKTILEKGHRKSMNIIWNKLTALRPTYWIHIEDDFLFYRKCDYVTKALRGLSLCGAKQILFNRNYAETIEECLTTGHILTESKEFALHEHIPNAESTNNCQYWPNYSFRPSMVDVKTILELGNYDSANEFFERDYADKWTAAGHKTAFFNCITNRHIGRLTVQRNDAVVANAYSLNDQSQFASKNETTIKILNLERRVDRKEYMVNLFKEENINNYQLIAAIDGKTLSPNEHIKSLFKGNDFGNRRGFIGCALSHYFLWIQLLKDTNAKYYIIMEDDVKICRNYAAKLNSLETHFKEKDLIFMGYHMFRNNRDKVCDIYDIDYDEISVEALNKDLYIGGTFCYSINKQGAFKMLSYINKNGIKHGIDYLMKINPDLICYETQPHLCFSEWNENLSKVDSDIQNDADSIAI